jgi:glucose-6-phosphate dehydrogenase assembly protein OpcA
MDQSAAVLPLQRPKDVSVADIEQELDKIWASRGESVAARAATFNLLVYESSAGSSFGPTVSVEGIASQNPCRVIELRSKGANEDAVEANVAAYCPVSRERSALVCCEYITIQGPESSFLRMCSTVSSLLIQELPTFLWWQGDLDLPLFDQLVEIASRVIVDTRSLRNPELALKTLHRLIVNGRACGDLNWKRLASWQELTAQAFDPPDRRNAIFLVDRVTIDYKAGNSSQAMLFLGWIASRLGWEPTQRVETIEHDYLINRVTFTSPNQKMIHAELAAVPLTSDATAAGDLIGLRLSSTDLSADACTVLCSETTGCMRMESMGGAQSCAIHQVSPIDQQTVDTLLDQNLHLTGSDRLFEESLASAIQILNKVENGAKLD